MEQNGGVCCAQTILFLSALILWMDGAQLQGLRAPEIELKTGTIYNLTIPDESSGETSRPPAWLMSSPEDCRILVRFVEFVLPDVDDTLVVGTGSDFWDSSTFFARFSGLFPRRSILLPTSTGWLWLNSTIGATHGQGMHVELEAIKPVTNLTLPGSGSIQIASPGYPLDYPSFADISWVISVPSGKSVVVRFNDIDLEEYYDKFYVGTGSDINNHSSHLTRISGQFNRTSTPTDLIVADESFFWIKFITDNSKTFSGFLITIYTKPDLAEDFITGEQDIMAVEGRPVNLASADYPNRYQHKQNVTWYIIPPINAQIRVDVISCHLESKHDFVQIDSLIDQNVTVRLSGNTLPRGYFIVYPVNGSVRINFNSDFSVSYQGFWIQVSAEYPVAIPDVDGAEASTMSTKSTMISNHTPRDKSELAMEETNKFMVILICAMGAVLTLFMVFGCILALFFVRRRRRKHVQRWGQVSSRVYTVPTYGAPQSNLLPLQPEDDQQRSLAASDDVPSHLDTAYAEFDYEAVKMTSLKAEIIPSPESDYHAYSETTFSATIGGEDTNDYSKISSDYETTIHNDYATTTENEYDITIENNSATKTDDDYATMIENDGNTSMENEYVACDDPQPGTDIDNAVLDVNNPYYSTAIRKGMTCKKDSDYHVYAPMTDERRSTHGSPRKPKRTFNVSSRDELNQPEEVTYVNCKCTVSDVRSSRIAKDTNDDQGTQSVQTEIQISDECGRDNVHSAYETGYMRMASVPDGEHNDQTVQPTQEGPMTSDTYFAGGRSAPSLTGSKRHPQPSASPALQPKHTFSQQQFAFENATYIAGNM